VSIERAARLPVRTASTTLPPPFTTSPPAKKRGFEVWPVSGST
jgi:hypothetical protein